MPTLDIHTPVAELQRFAADLEQVVLAARAGRDPRSTPEYVAAAYVGRAAVQRARAIPVTPETAEQLVGEIQPIAGSLMDLRKFVASATGPLSDALALIYSPQAEVEVATVLARARVAMTIRRFRAAKSLTLRQVADAVAATASFVSQLEFGRTLPTAARAAALDQALGIPSDAPTLARVVEELRMTREEIRAEASKFRTSLSGESAASRVVPRQASQALEEWRGRWTYSDLRALDIFARQPLMRELVHTLSNLPSAIQAKTYEFIRSLDSMRGDGARAATQAVRLEAIWRSERELEHLPNWSASTLLLELRDQFNPFTELDRSSERVRNVMAELQRRELDPQRIVSGPILRRTARLIVERLRVEATKGADEQRLPMDLQEWLAENAAAPSRDLSASLWSYWRSIEALEAFRHLAPPDRYSGDHPLMDKVVEWFVVRLTEEDLRNWPTVALDFESRRDEGPGLSAPWADAVQLREIDPERVAVEIDRRQRVATTDREVPPEFVAHSLLGSAYDAFIEGRLDEAVAFAAACVERYPAVARGYNHLGFLLMVGGRLNEALANLDRAEQLGFDEHEILDFNRACCSAILGQHESALFGFRRALGMPHVGSAVLCVVVGSELVPVRLEGPSDYLAVAALNAAWSAAASGDAERALEYLSIAGVDERTWAEDSIQGYAFTGEVVRRSRDRLEEKLAEMRA